MRKTPIIEFKQPGTSPKEIEVRCYQNSWQTNSLKRSWPNVRHRGRWPHGISSWSPSLNFSFRSAIGWSRICAQAMKKASNSAKVWQASSNKVLRKRTSRNGFRRSHSTRKKSCWFAFKKTTQTKFWPICCTKVANGPKYQKPWISWLQKG